MVCDFFSLDFFSDFFFFMAFFIFFSYDFSLIRHIGLVRLTNSRILETRVLAHTHLLNRFIRIEYHINEKNSFDYIQRRNIHLM